ncbi:MAG: T9SS type A sorting domain-containing protein, partial [Bacteroidota bacterium]
APELEISMLDTVCVDTSFCRAAVTVGITVNDACQVDEGEVLIGIDFNNNGEVESSSATTGDFSGTFPNYTYTANLPLGEHRFVFTVTDDCGNTTVNERVFRVNDCYVPFLICRGDRIYNLQPLLEEGDIDGDGVIEEAAALVNAEDLARCDFGDCSGDLTFSVNRVGEPYDRSQGSLFLDCEDRYEVELELYVWDNAFNPFAVQPDGTVGGPNWRSCTVSVFVQDPNLACNSCQVEDNITINGNITTLSGAPLDDVTVDAGGAATRTVTGEFGGYQIGGMVGNTYALHASKDADPRAGLTTLDVIILRRHLLGIQDITNPFELLAADLNRDGFVDLTDVLHLQGLILARESLYPDGPPWRFVDASWDGTGTPVETIMLESIGACSFNHNFVGVRMGDLNASFGADAGAVEGTISAVGRGRPTSFMVEDATFSAGELVDVNVRLPRGTEYAGGQAALYWNTSALEFRSRSSEHLDGERDFRDGTGYVWLSWKKVLANEELVQLRFRATADGRLRDYLRMIDQPGFADEVYTSGLQSHPLYLEWADVTAPAEEVEDPALLVEAGGSLLGVLPNPAHASTRIGVALAEAETVSLRVTDLSGRVVKRTQIRLDAGEQWLRVDVRDWTTGIYFYTLTTKAGSLSGKLARQ